jgi:hypothetical protein
MTTVSRTTSLVAGGDGNAVKTQSPSRLEDSLIRELSRKLEADQTGTTEGTAAGAGGAGTVSASVKGVMAYLAREIISEKMR